MPFESTLKPPELYGMATDRRVKYISSVFRHIKAIKMSAYELQVLNTAAEMRDNGD